MPNNYFIADSMLKSIEAVQKDIKDKSFDALSKEKKGELYASLFASRGAADAVRNKKSSLKVGATADAWQKKRDELILSSSFQTFLAQQGDANMKKLLLDGHGGAAEDAFQKYVLSQEKLPADVPDRYMPTAEERIEQQQEKLVNLDPRSDKAIEIYAEIFRTRRAVDAVRNKGGTLKVKVNGAKYAQTEDLSTNQVFKDFAKQYGGRLREGAQTGHGGAAEDMFKEHLLKTDHIPDGAPRAYMPTAVDHIDYLKEQLKAGGSQQEQLTRYTEIMATREAVNAVRGKKDSLAPQIDPSQLTAAYKKWNDCATFQDFLKKKPDEALKAATTGHGGMLQDEFKKYVLNLDHIPKDVPEGYTPNGLERLDVLKEKFKDKSYLSKTPEEKLALAAEVMATREVVKAVRKDAKSLEKPVNAAALKESVERWKNCAAFQNFVKDNPDEVRAGASDGHGGLLGDKFKDYVLKLDTLENDIPYDFMPTAYARIEALQKKIEDTPNPTAEQKQTLFAELIASRSAVEAVRGKPANLNKPIDAEKLKQERDKLIQSETFQNFLKDPRYVGALRQAALEGHGGSLEDLFKNYVCNLDVLPTDVPERWMPTALERTEALIRKINSPGLENNPNAEDLYVELMACREAVHAVHKKKDSLKVTVKPDELKAAREKWSKCEAFKTFVNDPESGAKKAATTGHGGALMEAFQEYVKSMDVIPSDIPDSVRPTAQERIEALQAKVKKLDPILDDADDYKAMYAQILAARLCVEAKRKDKDSLKEEIDPAKVNEYADQLMKSKTFGAFLEKNEDLARNSSVEGHGGQFAEQFQYYVRTMARLPQDVPEQYVPTAFDRIEGLQGQINSDRFKGSSLDTKVTLYAELLGARRAVGAERKKPDGLKKSMSPETVKAEADKLIKCSAFREFVEKNPKLAKDAATSGHGGELEDKFKEYVLNLDRIPEDVPKEYMPSALDRIEVLQKKINSKEFQGKNVPGQNAIYKELAATRGAVNSVRGNEKSLNSTVDAKALNKFRLDLSSGEGPDTFFDNANRKTLKDAALKGHGGAMEDLVRKDVLRQTVELGRLPKDLPARYRPTASETRQAIQKSIYDKNIALAQIAPEQLKKQVAAMMYLAKLEKTAANSGRPVPTLDPTEMEKQVNVLMGSQAFQDMFKDQQATRITRQNAGKGKLSDIFVSFNQNEQRIQQQLHQQQLQQQQLQQQLNQQQLNVNQPLNQQQLLNQQQQLNQQQMHPQNQFVVQPQVQINNLNQQVQNNQINQNLQIQHVMNHP